MTPSSRPGASGRRCATSPGSSRGSTGSSSTPAGTGCARPAALATDISAEVALATGDHTGRVEDRDVIGAAIAALSPDHQVVVALRYYRDLPVDEIARRLGVPPGTVQSRLHYALKHLHDAIDAADKGTVR